MFLHELADSDIDPLLLRLSRAAALALRNEDAGLASTFASVPSTLEAAYDGANHGLAHSVFETALVYEIFKAWIPMVHTEWECGYKGASGRKADLVVHPSPRTTWLFEAKWWMSMNAKSLSMLAGDALKMMSWEKASARYLVTFWYSATSEWKDDLDAIAEYCGRKQEGFTARSVYTAAFPTDTEPTRKGGGSYFALAIMAIGRG